MNRNIISLLLSLTLLLCWPSALANADADSSQVEFAIMHNPSPISMIPLRSEMDEMQEPAANYYSGTPVIVHSRHGDWCAVSVGGNPGNPMTGYARTQDLRFNVAAVELRSDMEGGAVRVSTALLTAPSDGADVIGTYDEGTRLTAFGIIGRLEVEYLHVTIAELDGYINANDVMLDWRAGQAYPEGRDMYGVVYNGALRGNSLPPLYSSPEISSANVIGEVEFGTTVVVHRQQGSLYEVSLYDRRGWMAVAEVFLDAQNIEYEPVESIGFFTDEPVKLYSFPDVKADVTAEVTANAGNYLHLDVINRAGAYWHVTTLDGRTGFVEGIYRYDITSRSYTNMQHSDNDTSAGIVCTPEPDEWLNVRSEPSLSADVIDKLYSGVQVKILSSPGKWTEVFVNGQSGYVMTKFITVVGHG
ncbi:MAG: SH3 domain-containing protein [Oscillospiraceae bacterium]|jgi:mannosyl-glycoprotein endo-beta-N-acetylglucosaminidase|nr:SH3 domain-containing protein [Oscillospiraceae bacterium]